MDAKQANLRLDGGAERDEANVEEPAEKAFELGGVTPQGGIPIGARKIGGSSGVGEAFLTELDLTPGMFEILPRSGRQKRLRVLRAYVATKDFQLLSTKGSDVFRLLCIQVLGAKELREGSPFVKVGGTLSTPRDFARDVLHGRRLHSGGTAV
jgi:hypothetical protein